MTHPTLGSSPSYASPSPIRSSPLTAPPHFSPTRSPSPSTSTSRRLTESTSGPSSYTTRRFSQPSSSLARPTRSILSPLTHSSPPPLAFESNSPPLHPASPPLSRSQPLLGSYQLSLLHSRMSRTQSHSVPSSATEGFAIRIGAVGKGKSCPAHLRAPPPLTLPFSATYYDLLDPAGGRRSGASQTPWVGNIDVEQNFIDQCSARSSPPSITHPPEIPGYEVAPIGQLQIIIKNATTPLRVFVVPYDLRGLSMGSRLLVRERTYVETSPDVSASLPASPTVPSPRKESLRYAIQLQFICHPSHPSPRSTRESSTTRRARQSAPAAPSVLNKEQLFARRYYLSKSLKVIFSAQAPSSTEKLRTERNDEVVPPSNELFLGSAGRVVGFSPASAGRKGSEEWEMVRQKWMARRRVEEAGMRVDVAAANGPKEKEPGANLVSPTATSSPLPILSPSTGFLPVIHSAGPSRTPSRPSTPSAEAFPRVVSPPPGPGASLLQLSKPPGAGRTKRHGSRSIAERELSEKLRAMDMDSGDG